MDLTNLFYQGDNLDVRIIKKFERDLIRIYKTALENIRAELAQIYSIYGEKPDPAMLRRTGRLKALQRNIQLELLKIPNAFNATLKEAIVTVYEQAYNWTGFISESSLQTGLDFTKLSTSAIRAAVFNPYDKIKWSTRNLKNIGAMIDRVRNNITEGLIQGWGFSKTAHELTNELNIGISKSSRIVWTETHRAQQAGRLLGMNKVIDAAEKIGMKALKHWDAINDKHSHKIKGTKIKNHVEMESIDPNAEGLFLFTTMDGIKKLVEGPGLTGTSDDIQCRCQLTMKFLDAKQGNNKIPKTFNKWKEERL
jgi:hypothetical protein